jgi:salicylate hydroxylase
MSRLRIAVVGAGVAGAIVAKGLATLPDVELLCFEQVGPDDALRHATALNVGPNALTVLRALDPALHQTVTAASYPWRRWQVSLANGELLLDLDLADFAPDPGIRIRWADLYRLVRAPIASLIRYRTRVTGLERQPDGRLALACTDPSGASAAVADVDLVIAADGRFSRLRELLFGAAPTRYLPVGMFRVMKADPAQRVIDDYAQWFAAGPVRLLAYRVPRDDVYIGGAVPLGSAETLDALRARPERLLEALMPPGAPAPCAAYRYLVDIVHAELGRIHWARQQEIAVAFRDPSGRVLLLGDAAHAMTTTIGQGATQAIEDAAVTVALAHAAAVRGRLDAIAELTAAVEAVRAPRIDAVMTLSRDATDTLLPGADPAAGTRAKAAPAFRARLAEVFGAPPDLARLGA